MRSKGFAKLAFAAGAITLLTGGHPIRSSEIGEQVMPSEEVLVDAPQQLRKGDRILTQRIGSAPIAILKDHTVFSFNGKNLGLSADDRLQMFALNPDRLNPSAERPPAFCKKISHASVGKPLKSLGLYLTKTPKNDEHDVRACFLDVDGDGRFEYAQVSHRQGKIKHQPVAIEPVAYTLEGGLALPRQSRAILKFKNINRHRITLDYDIRIRGIELPMMPIPIEIASLPQTVGLFGERIEITSADYPSRTAVFTVRAPFPASIPVKRNDMASTYVRLPDLDDDDLAKEAQAPAATDESELTN